MISNFFTKYKFFFLCIFAIISIISLSNTIYKGFLNSCDFQWQPSVLMWSGINHYEKFLIQGNYDFQCQGGQYAHILHVILFPYTLVNWETAKIMWVLTNLFFVFCIPLLISRHLNISKYKTVLLILIFITCYPTRMTINYGQQSLFVLFFLLISIYEKSNLKVFFSGFSIIKYSSGYVLFLNYLLRRDFKNLLIASLPYIIGWIFYFNYTNSNWLVNFFEPIELILSTGYTRTGDLYSLCKIYLLEGKSGFYGYLLILLIFLINIFFIYQINSINIFFLKFSLILICPLVFFPHSNYDYVLMFPLLCYSIFKIELLINKINFYFIIYYFYINRLVRHLVNHDEIYQPFMMLLTILLIISNINFYHKKKLHIFKKFFIN
jgi:hypothetical protein